MFDNVAKTAYVDNVKLRIARLKQVHYIAAIVLFVATFVFCSTYDSDFNITKMSLSHFGIYQKIGFIWNGSLFIIGVTLMIEAFINIHKYMPGSKILYLFIVSIICLLLTASITMNYRIHYYFAFTYFIGYTVSIFLFGFFLMNTDFRIGIISIVISVASLIVPISILTLLHSYAIPELAHTTLVFIWVSITKFDAQYKSFIKRFGL